jgi:ubiquitin carboxyl-terminal hydrolase 10
MHQQFVPMVGVSVPSNYRPVQHSPALSTTYQPPPPMPPHTPSSTHSSQVPPPPTPPTPQVYEPVPTSAPAAATPVAPPAAPAASAAPTAPEPAPMTSITPFRPPLPWLSRPDLDFPTRTPRLRRRKKALDTTGNAVSLPTEQQVTAASAEEEQPTAKTSQSESKPPASAAAIETLAEKDAKDSPKPSQADAAIPVEEEKNNADAIDASATNNPDTTVAKPPPVKAPPSSWANLFAKAASAGQVPSSAADGAMADDATADGPVGVVSGGHLPGSAASKANALAEVIRAYRVNNRDHIAFLEPRGLVNTGNMCYLNSVLQVLTFCVPFHDFMDQVSKRAAHSFKSDTPLIDAMIMFMQDFKVLKTAPSEEQLRRSLKGEDLERFGEPFTPEFVYEAIRHDKRFENMKRGHQQDAEEFLGFLLQSLKEECSRIMSASTADNAESETASANVGEPAASSNDWLEVGRKQRAAVTRSSGSSSSTPKTPIDKIFGGEVRSELRVPGNQDSITIQPSQPLQLDIDSDDVRNVVDALRGVTRPETIRGDFKSPRGKDVSATKQVFIESLPPILILHLKRFQFDEGTGTVKKIAKKIGYPLDLEIPRDALSRQSRQTMGDGVMPKYKLVGVIYHHGKNASVGHYTVDVRRQDGDSWIRIDDTQIRTVRSEDVAESAAEGEVREARKDTASPAPSANRFGAMAANGDDGGDDEGWNQVQNSAGGKRWTNVVNGNSQPAKAKQTKDNIKDNRVAYLLFYQRV